MQCPEQRLVWYVAYGSNLSTERFACYLEGGRPEGSLRSSPGFRDRTPPRSVRSVSVPGGIFFAGESKMWTGGTAFLDPDLDGVVAARAYLITAGQFADLAEQEMLRNPGGERDLSVVLGTGRHSYGAGRYETLLGFGEHDGVPMLTVSAPWTSSDAALSPPTGRYLATIGRGLMDTHAWDTARAGAYLASAPGATAGWRAEQVAALLN